MKVPYCDVRGLAFVSRKVGSVKKHAKERMDMPVLCDESEVVYVFNLIKLVRNIDAG